MKNIIKRVLYRIRGHYTTEALIKRGMTVGNNFKRLHDVELDPAHCWLISISDNVTMAPYVHILAHDASTKIFLGYTKVGRVNIGDNVFIGANTIVLPNVTIGNNVIVGANSTVTRSLAENGVYFGSPAKFICTIDEYIENNKMLLKSNPCFNETYQAGNISNEKKIEMILKLDNNIGYIE